MPRCDPSPSTVALRCGPGTTSAIWNLAPTASEADVRASAELLTELLRALGRDRRALGTVVIVGFSQGGAMAYHLGLRWPERLAGVAALSTYLVVEDALEAELSAAATAPEPLPVFVAHGTYDPTVRKWRGESAMEQLQGLGTAARVARVPHGPRGVHGRARRSARLAQRGAAAGMSARCLPPQGAKRGTPAMPHATAGASSSDGAVSRRCHTLCSPMPTSIGTTKYIADSNAGPAAVTAGPGQ